MEGVRISGPGHRGPTAAAGRRSVLFSGGAVSIAGPKWGTIRVDMVEDCRFSLPGRLRRITLGVAFWVQGLQIMTLRVAGRVEAVTAIGWRGVDY